MIVDRCAERRFEDVFGQTWRESVLLNGDVCYRYVVLLNEGA